MADNMHTPGPWEIRRSKDGSGDVGITAPGLPNVLAECFGAMRRHDERAADEALANARLIVAAPDMLEALKGFNLGPDAIVGAQGDDIIVRLPMSVITRAASVVAKAEGRS